MAYAKIDPQVLGYLGRALSLEMTAVQQYLSVSRLLKLRGFDEMAAKFQTEAQQEIGHAERIIGRMLVLGVAPNATQLRPAKLGDSLPAVLASVQSLEAEIVNYYQQAVKHCAAVDDFDSQLFFDQLLQEERQHVSALSDWQQQHLRPRAAE
ncbi:bacterioferritin [Pseudomonadota bacterium]